MSLAVKELMNMNKEQIYVACHNNTAILPILLMWGFTAVIFLIVGLSTLRKESYSKFIWIYFPSLLFITLFALLLIFFPTFSKSISDFFIELFST